MPYCRTCGTEVSSGAVYCPNCGATTGFATVQATPTEFDRLTKDTRTQEHWMKRVVAYVIDWVVVSVATAILALIAFMIFRISLSSFGTGFFFPLAGPAFGILGISAILFLLYFTMAEGTYQKTIGKSLLGLHVVTLDGKPVNLEKALIRNVSKIYWPFLLLDLIGGFFMNVEPGQRYLDKIAYTIVLSK